jgi:hypothetical protein
MGKLTSEKWRKETDATLPVKLGKNFLAKSTEGREERIAERFRGRKKRGPGEQATRVSDEKWRVHRWLACANLKLDLSGRRENFSPRGSA